MKTKKEIRGQLHCYIILLLSDCYTINIAETLDSIEFTDKTIYQTHRSLQKRTIYERLV